MLVLREKFIYNRYYGSHANFTQKRVDTVITATELQAIKTRIGHSNNQTKVSMIGHGVLFTAETRKYALLHIHIYYLSNHE